MKVPLLDLRQQYASLRTDLDAAVARVIESQYFILGPEVAAFEQEIAGFCGVRRAIGVSSGTDALLVALMALDVGPGDEVVTTPFSFFATAGVIARLGATPVFVDIESDSYNLDATLLEAAITERTRAIVPVHLYGRCVDNAAIGRIAAAAAVPVVEDAAQAIGARDAQGAPAGTTGLCGCFSFFPTKNLGAFGDAGLVTTNDEGFASRVELLRVHGGERRYYHRQIGGNFRIDALQAAVLRVKLSRLLAWNEARRRNAGRYRRLFTEAGLEDWIEAPADVDGHIYHQFVVRAKHRDALREWLAAEGVGSEVYYPVPLHLQECFTSLGHRVGSFPQSERAASEVLALPIYPELTAEQQAWVVDRIATFFQNRQAQADRRFTPP
jgi:dTDP-4-amino-4,6-dideoxygalactose transaminase